MNGEEIFREPKNVREYIIQQAGAISFVLSFKTMNEHRRELLEKVEENLWSLAKVEGIEGMKIEYNGDQDES